MKARKKYLVLAAMVIFILGGCTATRPRFEEPALGMPNDYGVFQDEKYAVIERGARWWEAFGDSRLNELMDEAFRDNLDIVMAAERLNQSRAAAKIASSSRWPSVNVSGSAGRVKRAGQDAGDSFDLSASASYTLDLFGRIKAAAGEAELLALASRSDLKELYLSVSGLVAGLYYSALELDKRIELSKRTIGSLESTAALVEERYRSGLTSALDVYQSREALEAARAALFSSQAALETTMDSLRAALGKYPEDAPGGLALILGEAELPNPPGFHAGLPSELIKSRPDMEAALFRLMAADRAAAEAVADRFPSFNLMAAYGGSSAELSDVLSSPSIFWSLLLDIAMPVFDAGRRSWELKRSEAAFREKLAAYHKSSITAMGEVSGALKKIGHMKNRELAVQKRLQASEDAHRLAVERYRAGLETYLTVLLAERNLFEAKSALIGVRAERIEESINLATALGGGWMDTYMDGQLQGKTAMKDGKENE